MLLWVVFFSCASDPQKTHAFNYACFMLIPDRRQAFFSYGPLFLVFAVKPRSKLPLPSVESGTWEDSDGSECANAGENVSYLAVVKNEGIITLGSLNVEDVRAGMNCEEPESGLLGQGEEYKCRGSSQV